MGNAQSKRHISEAEYFAFCEQEEGRYEYYQGEIFAMTGGMPNHNAIVSAINGELYARLKNGRCCIFSSDQRILVEIAGLYTCPDLSVFCQEPVYGRLRRDTLVNPTLLVEVLSASTEDYDRTTKFNFYKQLPSLLEYMLVSSEKKQVDVFTRQQDDVWSSKTYRHDDDEILLTARDLSLPLSDLYSMAVLPVPDRRPGQ